MENSEKKQSAYKTTNKTRNYGKSVICRQIDSFHWHLFKTLERFLKQESLANAKRTRDSSACMKAHCPLGCSR